MEEEKKYEKDKNKSGMCAASLTLGILSLVFAWNFYIAIPTGILAIILGQKTIKQMGSKLGKAGVITGIIGLTLCAFIYFSLIGLIIADNFLY